MAVEPGGSWRKFMLRKFVIAFAIAALAAVFAGTVPAHAPHCWITLFQPSQVEGTPLAAGDYNVTVMGDKAIFAQGKHTWTVAVKIQNDPAKFDETSIRYDSRAGQQNITEIRIGGSKTKLVFE
jgi:hypothetical protein